MFKCACAIVLKGKQKTGNSLCLAEPYNRLFCTQPTDWQVGLLWSAESWSGSHVVDEPTCWKSISLFLFI